MVYFGFYHSIKDILPKAEVKTGQIQIFFYFYPLAPWNFWIKIVPCLVVSNKLLKVHDRSPEAGLKLCIIAALLMILIQDSKLEILRRLGIGFIAGTLGSICNIPFDVAKSRIQGPQPVPGQIKYKGTIKTIVKVYQEEG